jgi:hypothetical protein
MIQHEMLPTNLSEDVLNIAHKIAMTQPPRQSVLDVCPVCSRPIVIRHGHAMCVSGMCRGRILEGCCGE